MWRRVAVAQHVRGLPGDRALTVPQAADGRPKQPAGSVFDVPERDPRLGATRPGLRRVFGVPAARPRRRASQKRRSHAVPLQLPAQEEERPGVSRPVAPCRRMWHNAHSRAMNGFASLHPAIQGLLGGTVTWLLTAAGAATVLMAARPSQKLLDAMLGFAAGVMTAASFWSLLAPAIEIAKEMQLPAWLPPAVGFAAGAAFMRLLDLLLPHLHTGPASAQAEGLKTAWHRTTLLVMAITLHNIPEGMAIGVGFGAAALGMGGATLASAMALALGIGIQNVPEGMAVAMPLRRAGLSVAKSFWYGQISALVEPVAAVVGVAGVMVARPLLPYVLAFAAGAMIFVVVEELIPEAQEGGNSDIATGGVVLGFLVMMILDVALG